MTDEQQPQRDLPVAGRAPDPQPAADATVPLKRPGAAAGDAATVPLKRPGATPAADPALGPGETSPAGPAQRPGETSPAGPTQRPGETSPADPAQRPGEMPSAGGPAGEATTRLRVPTDAAAPVAATAGDVAVDDQPTVERPARPEVDGETKRLRPPAVVPGTPDPTAEPAPTPGPQEQQHGRQGHGGREQGQREQGQREHGREEHGRGEHGREEHGQREHGPEEKGRPEHGRAAVSPAEPDGRDPALSPDPVMSGTGAAPVPAGEPPSVPRTETARTGDGPATGHPPRRRLSSAGTLIWVLLALFGFTLVVQLRSNDTDEGLATARQEDLVRILSDLEARDTRLQAEISALETSQRQLTSGVAGREAALAEAEKRATELGLLAGTLPGRGPGLRIDLNGVKASAILNAVQELRGAGGEVMQLNGAAGGAVRIVASTYFVEAAGGGLVADGVKLSAPYTLWVIGQPQTMQTALQIPGGVVASVHSDGGSVTMEQRPAVEVTAVREPGSLRYARPVS